MKRIVIFSLLLFFLHISCNTYTQGERIYQTKCANCHGMNGEGLASLYPALATSKIVTEQINLIPCIILKGKFTLDKNGNKISEMPPVPNLGEIEITNLINYLESKYGKQKVSTQLDSIRAWKENCK